MRVRVVTKVTYRTGLQATGRAACRIWLCYALWVTTVTVTKPEYGLVEVMRLDGDDVRYGEIVACWARLSPAELCGFESWYRINFGSESVRNEMDVPDTEIVDALPQ